MKSLLIIFIFTAFGLKISAEIKAPNYNFTLDKFKTFMPGQTLGDVSKLYPKGTLIFKDTNFTTYKYEIKDLNYKFSIFVQFLVKDKTVTDFHTKLPQYFLHDIFHKSLIERLGKQGLYKKKEEQALYKWSVNELNHYYSGACTLNCFALYYSVEKSANEQASGYKSLIKKLKYQD